MVIVFCRLTHGCLPGRAPARPGITARREDLTPDTTAVALVPGNAKEVIYSAATRTGEAGFGSRSMASRPSSRFFAAS